MNVVYRLMCLSGVLLVLTSCKKADEKKVPVSGDMPPSAVVVKVDGVAFTFGEMDKRASGLHTNAIAGGLYYVPNKQHEATAHFRKRVINEFVYKTLMLNEAARLDITISEQDQALAIQKLTHALAQNRSSINDYFNKGPYPPDVMRSEFHDRLVIDKMLSQEAQRNIKLMDEDVEKVVDDIGMTNAIRRVTLEAARKQILDGAPFDDVARTISQDVTTARQGGALSEFARDSKYYEEPFKEAAFSLAPGEVSEIVETTVGYHIIKVLARNPAQAAKDDVTAVPETVRASHILINTQPADRRKIAEVLYMKKFAEGRQAFFEELKAKAKIENTLFPDMQYKVIGNAK